MTTQRAILIILDGWGLGADPAVDAIAQADTPNFDQLLNTYPHSTLVTFGEAVGLPEGQMGNSEVGHLNIGAGRVVYQTLAQVNKAVRDQSLAQNEKLQAAIRYAKANNKPFHLMGLVSDGGVHSHIEHLLALIDILQASGLTQIYIHAFTDGRDTDPRSGLHYLDRLLNHCAQGKAQLATVVGRYYAMDRDHRWERVKIAYDTLVHAQGTLTSTPLATVQERYLLGQTDEFLDPIIVAGTDGEPLAKVQDGDVLLCFNFRTDRPREISEVLTQRDMPDYEMYKRSLHYLTMTRYDETYAQVEVLFDNKDLTETLGEVLSQAGKTQVRIAETEKYPHVTFFFSGGREEAFPNERRLLIPSAKEVATYDQKPAMSAPEIAEAIIADMQQNKPDFICLNFANTDMVGHTGDFSAVMEAAQVVDRCLGQLLATAAALNYEALVIADHGNGDYMLNSDGSPNTAHSMNPVPCIFVSPRASHYRLQNGKLADVAPTLLWMMDIPAPAAMDGQVLLQPA